MNNKFSEISIIFLIVTILCASFFSFHVSLAKDVNSSQESISGSVMTIIQDTVARSAPDEGASVVVKLSKGDSIFVVGENDGWYEIFYKGKSAYVKVTGTSTGNANDEEISIAAAADSNVNSALEEEFKKKQQFDVTYVDSFERQQRRNRSALVWKIVIAVLVVSIIVISVVIGIRNRNSIVNEDEDNNSESDKR
ncbi:SH3 domain-containing protein [Butyrivibrio sp. AE2015]|uniref:SH3 domain-containing protein n=1 Tax=Butyrivibrio sp. AE2015 TaxID=1280663 RepID=UPI0003B5B278|nr:SH3 domain-containing protein [Butyrivibrio sp. AE2015]